MKIKAIKKLAPVAIVGIGMGWGSLIAPAPADAGCNIFGCQATGSGGAPRKIDFSNLTFFCDYSSSDSLLILGTAGDPSQEELAKFQASGKVNCCEVPIGLVNPSCSDAVPGFEVGIFSVVQPTRTEEFRSLQNVDGANRVKLDGTTVGSPPFFILDNTPGFGFTDVSTQVWDFTTMGDAKEQLAIVWEADDTAVPNGPPSDADRFCNHLGAVDEGERCIAVTGTEATPDPTDYTLGSPPPGRALAYQVPGGQVLGDLSVDLCHAQDFDVAKVFEVDARDHSSNGDAGIGLDTGIDVFTNSELIIYTRPDDLWTSGNCARYSSASGQDQYLPMPELGTPQHDDFLATEDDEDRPEDAQLCTNAAYIGLNWKEAVKKNNSNKSKENMETRANAVKDAFGTLYGAVDPSFSDSPDAADLYLFPIDEYFNGGLPDGIPEGRLRFMYFDSNVVDNAGSIEVVVSQKPIDCSTGDLLSDARAVDELFQSCEVQPVPTYKIGSGGRLPIKATCCVPADTSLASYDSLRLNNVLVRSDRLKKVESVGTGCALNGGFGVIDTIKLDLKRKEFQEIFLSQLADCNNNDSLEFSVAIELAGREVFVDPSASIKKLRGCP